MGKFDGVLLVSDFDDTLYDLNLEVSDKNRRAIEYFQSENGVFTVATGRSHSTFHTWAAKLPLNAPVVLSNGAAVYDFAAEAYVWETTLPPRAAGDISMLMAAMPELGFEGYHNEEIYAFRPNLVTEYHMKRVGATYTACAAISDMPQPWVKVLVEQDYPALQKARDWMLARYGQHYEVIFSNRYLLEITAKGCNKGGMIRRVAEKLGISQENLYCVGDNQNDIPMLAESAVPFAPANCAQEVKDWGAQILCHCNDGVVAAVIERLDERY